jgi:hypothetical protein
VVAATDVLSVACWDGTLSFYQLTGEQIGKDKVLGSDPCSVKRAYASSLAVLIQTID